MFIYIPSRIEKYGFFFSVKVCKDMHKIFKLLKQVQNDNICVACVNL